MNSRELIVIRRFVDWGDFTFANGFLVDRVALVSIIWSTESLVGSLVDRTL